MNPSHLSAKLSGRIAFIEAAWHQEIVAQARVSFMNHIADSEIDESSVDLYTVPGSLEIPLQCQRLAKSERYDIIICAGLIVDGGIYRHDFVASTVLDGMMRVQLDTEVPILSVVLTPHHFNEQDAHQSFFFEHFKIKGKEAADACLRTLENKVKLDQLQLDQVA